MVNHDLEVLECLEKLMATGNMSGTNRKQRMVEACAENISAYNQDLSDAYDPLKSTVSEKILFTTVISIVILFVTGGNLLTIVAVANGRYLKSLSHFFIASLAVADLVVGCVVMPFNMLYTVTFDGVWVFGPIMCDIWQFADYVGCTGSLTNLCTIALDRYLTVSRPLQTIHQRTKRRVWIMIFVTWMIPIVYWTVLITVLRSYNGPSIPGKCSLLWQPAVTVMVAVSIIIYIPILVILCLFTMIYWTLRQHVRSLGAKLRSSHLRRRRGSDWPSFSKGSDSDVNSVDVGESIQLHSRTVVQDVQGQPNEYGRHELDVNTGCWGFLAQSLDQYRIGSDTSENIQAYSSSLTDADVLHEVSLKQKEKAKLRQRVGVNSNKRRRKVVAKATIRLSSEADDNDDVFEEANQFPDKSMDNSKRTPKEAAKTLNSNRMDTHGNDSNKSEEANGECVEFVLLGNGNAPGKQTKQNGVSSRDISRAESNVKAAQKTRSKGQNEDFKGENTRNAKKAYLISNSFPEDLEGFSSVATSESPDSVDNCESSPSFIFPNGDSSTLENRKKKSSSYLVKSRLSRQIRAARMLSIIMTFLLLCWLPFAIMWPLRSFCPDCVTQRLFNFSFWLNYANSAINPILYCLCNPAFRIAFRKLLCGTSKV